MTMGISRDSKWLIKLYMLAAKTAGSSTGMNTRTNVVRWDAPETRAASSRLGSIALNAPAMTRKIVVTPLSPSRKIRPQRLYMFNGPSLTVAPRRAKTLRSQILNKPLRGERRKIHEIPNRSPGTAMGMSMRAHATFLKGMSVLSVRNANNTAMATESRVLITANTTVLKNIV